MINVSLLFIRISGIRNGGIKLWVLIILLGLGVMLDQDRFQQDSKHTEHLEIGMRAHHNDVSERTRRNLNNNIDISRTSVSGLSDFEVWQSKTITVIPRDSTGSVVGDGCDIYIQVSNK